MGDREMMALYLDYLAVEKGLSPNTITAYRSDLNRLQRSLGPKRKLERATKEDLLKVLNDMRVEGRAPRSVARWTVAVKGFFAYMLAEGVLDFERNLPAREIDLVAPTAILLAREDLHPAVVPLFIQAAEEAFGNGDLLTEPGRFPSSGNLDAPLAPAAKEYFKNGSSFLYRVFPFAIAATLDRLKIMLLPVLTLLLPLVRVAPPLMRWRTRRKIFRWYRHLERIERESETDRTARLAQLDEIEREIVETVDVPASYMEELHQLRLHLERVRARIDR